MQNKANFEGELDLAVLLYYIVVFNLLKFVDVVIQTCHNFIHHSIISDQT